jgi:WD40 repeat protein
MIRNRSVLETYPLQTHTVAHLFDPLRICDMLYDNQNQEFRWISTESVVLQDWSSYLQQFEVDDDWHSSITLSHDSNWLAIVPGNNNTIQIWDTTSGKPLQAPLDCKAAVRCITFSNKSTYLASVAEDGSVSLWEVSTGKCIGTRDCPSDYPITSLLFSPDDESLVLWSNAHEGMFIWPTHATFAKGESLHLQGLEQRDLGNDGIMCVAFSRDSKLFALGSWEGKVYVCDSGTGTRLQTLVGHTDYITSVALSADTTRVVSASEDHIVKIWDLDTGACLLTVHVGRALHAISFDCAASYLPGISNAIDMSVLSPSYRADLATTENLERPRVGFSSDHAWITYGGRNTGWIPEQHRGSYYAVCGDVVISIATTGRLWKCSISPDEVQDETAG